MFTSSMTPPTCGSRCPHPRLNNDHSIHLPFRRLWCCCCCCFCVLGGPGKREVIHYRSDDVFFPIKSGLFNRQSHTQQTTTYTHKTSFFSFLFFSCATKRKEGKKRTERKKGNRKWLFFFFFFLCCVWFTDFSF